MRGAQTPRPKQSPAGHAAAKNPVAFVIVTDETPAGPAKQLVAAVVENHAAIVAIDDQQTVVLLLGLGGGDGLAALVE
jgi:hypothetical protein